MRVMDDEDLSQLWLRYAAGESWDLIVRSFFAFLFIRWGFSLCVGLDARGQVM